MKLQLCLAGVVLASGMLVSPAEAGLMMVYEQESYGRPGKEATTVYMDKDRMRTETKGGSADQVFIFRGDKKLYWLIDNRDRTYMEISREDLKELKGKMDEANRTLDEQMKNMPPEQRKMVEAMMKDRMPKQPPRTEYKKVASGVKVNRWVCDQYDGIVGREKKEEVWTADPGQFDLRPEEVQVFDSLREFSEEFSKQGMPFYRIEMEKGKKGSDYTGVPVRMIRFSHGKKVERMELTEAQRKEVAPSMFELPAGYKKKEMH
jgi:Domain of unknown function (DUF4412)